MSAVDAYNGSWLGVEMLELALGREFSTLGLQCKCPLHVWMHAQECLCLSVSVNPVQCWLDEKPLNEWVPYA